MEDITYMLDVRLRVSVLRQIAFLEIHNVWSIW